ncbi:hypothetical protein Tco_0299292 [Tanacetum coccineum]
MLLSTQRGRWISFYIALNANDQDSLNSAAGGNFLDKMTVNALKNYRGVKIQDVAALTTEVSELKNLMKTMLIDKQKAQAPATVKAVEQSCVTCGGALSLNNCSATDATFIKDHNSSMMQNQGQGLQNQMTNLTEMLSKFITSNTASSSNSGTLPSQTEPEQNLEMSMDKVQKPCSENTAQVPPPEDHDSIFIEIPKPRAKKTVQEPNSPKPDSYQPKLPYPERMKVREKDTPSAQQSRLMKLFKQLRLEIGLKDTLIEMPKFNKWLSTLLRNKEKLEEIAITTVNAECSAIILNKVPEKLEDPGKFLIPCASRFWS